MHGLRRCWEPTGRSRSPIRRTRWSRGGERRPPPAPWEQPGGLSLSRSVGWSALPECQPRAHTSERGVRGGPMVSWQKHMAVWAQGVGTMTGSCPRACSHVGPTWWWATRGERGPGRDELSSVSPSQPPGPG